MRYNRERLEHHERQTLAPYAALASESRGRIYDEDESRYRTAFQKDRDRVIHTSAFRRLEYKTQVFVNYQGDHYRTRLTHTLEVAQVAKSISRALGLNEDLTETIALAHDLGHPPFGHAGEDTLNDLAEDAGGFDHNKQSLRVVTRLERRYPNFPGLNLTWETLEGIMKHETEYDLPDNRWEPDKQPTLEAQIVDMADEMAYSVHDLDDGLRSGHLTPQQISEVTLVAKTMATLSIDPRRFGSQEHALLIREMLGLLIEDAVDHIDHALGEHTIQTLDDLRNAPHKIANSSPEVRDQLRALKRFLFHNFYEHYRQRRMKRKAQHVLERIFGAYMRYPDMLPDHVQSSVAERGVMRAVTDYIAGMTDRFAGDEYRRLFDPHALT